MVTTATRRGSFGGRAGTWFRKRKVMDNNENQSTRPRLAYTTGGSIVIGWDDLLCRPIYQRSPELTPPSPNQQDDKENDDANTSMPSGAFCLDLSSSKFKMPKHRKKTVRSYGTARRKHRSICDLDVDDSDVDADEVFADKVTLTIYKKYADSSSDHDSDNKINVSTTTSPTRLARRVSHGSCLSVERPKNTEDDFDFIDDPRDATVDVTCETPRASSLRVAREFFQRLDREHQLTIANGPSTVPRHTTTGRSTSLRRCSAVAVKLVQEYEDYKKACQESLVSPIEKETFARNRSRFFESTTEFHDGFLDEED